MMIKNRISLFVATFLIIGFFFLALPEIGYSGFGSELGCCGIISDPCIGCGSGECAISGLECAAIGGDTHDIDNICLDNGTCTLAPKGSLGCCVISAGNCNENQEFGGTSGCIREDIAIAWFFETECSEVPQCAPPPTLAPVVRDVPTLSGWGFISLAVVLAIVGLGAFLVRRRKVSA